MPAPKTDAERYLNQGVAALQVYHYVDAYRSFLESERRDPSLVMACVGEILAALQIGSSSEGWFFAQAAYDKINVRAKRQPLNKSELTWSDFAHAYMISSSYNYVKSPGEEIKSLAQTFSEIRNNDAQNFDGISLSAWLAMSTMSVTQAKDIFKSVLAHQPENIGAHHSLLHLAESENDSTSAKFHGAELSRLAPGSAHAQHMYGHTLPQKGLWAEALEYFKKADRIHMAWASKNGFEPSQDWHYGHNLDLMAASYVALGDFTNARETWARGANAESC